MKIKWKWWTGPIFFLAEIPLIGNSKTLDTWQRRVLFRYGFTIEFSGDDKSKPPERIPASLKTRLRGN